MELLWLELLLVPHLGSFIPVSPGEVVRFDLSHDEDEKVFEIKFHFYFFVDSGVARVAFAQIHIWN